MLLLILRLCCWISCLRLALAASSGDSAQDVELWPRSKLQLQTYKTEPNFKGVKVAFKTLVKDQSLLDPGYIFLTISVVSGSHATKGAHIYDNNGHLIWYGAIGRVQDFQVSDFFGTHGKHLSIYSFDEGAAHFLDQSYSRLKRYKYGTANGHEFNVQPGGRSVLLIKVIRREMNLKAYTGHNKGWVLDNCIVEIDLATGKRIFRWCITDHAPLWHTSAFSTAHCIYDKSLVKINGTMRSRKAGCSSWNYPWDFAHSNAIDKYDGDYIYSVRFFNQIIKVAGPQNRHGVKPGTILWRLGGYANDFDKNFTFSRQHHVRFLSVTQNETVISLFNNAWEGTNKPSADASEGLIIKLNNVTMKATLVQQLTHPDGALSEGRGSTQVLPNGNTLVGYGRYPEFVEHSPNGTVLMHGRFFERPFKLTPDLNVRSLDFSYRAFKFPWVGKPNTRPRLIAYSRSCTTSKSSPLIAYVSWNGATEVVTWRFFVSSTTKHGPWAPAGDFPKDGFETVAHLSNKIEAKLLKFTPFVRVEALNATGGIIGKRRVKTFVPKNRSKNNCNKNGCNKPNPFKYTRAFARSSCSQGWLLPGYIALGLIVVMLEIIYRACRVLPIMLDDFTVRRKAAVPNFEQFQQNDRLLHESKPEQGEG